MPVGTKWLFPPGEFLNQQYLGKLKKKKTGIGEPKRTEITVTPRQRGEAAR